MRSLERPVTSSSKCHEINSQVPFVPPNRSSCFSSLLFSLVCGANSAPVTRLVGSRHDLNSLGAARAFSSDARSRIREPKKHMRGTVALVFAVVGGRSRSPCNLLCRPMQSPTRYKNHDIIFIPIFIPLLLQIDILLRDVYIYRFFIHKLCNHTFALRKNFITCLRMFGEFIYSIRTLECNLPRFVSQTD